MTELTRPPESAIRSWLAVASVALGTFVVVTTEFLPIGLLGSLAHDMNVSVGVAGLMVTVPGLVAAFFAPAVTLMAGAVDRKHLLIGFALLVMASNLLVAAAPGFATLLFARVLLGISVGGFWTFAAAAGRRLVAAEQGGRATALILAGISVGTVVGVPIGTALGALSGWRFAFGCAAGLGLVNVLAQAMWLKPLPGGQAVSAGSLFALFKNPFMVVGFVASALVTAGHFSAYTYVEPYLAGVVRLSPPGISWTFAAYGVAGVLGNFVGERATAWNLKGAFVAVALLMACALALATRAEHQVAMAVALLVLWGAAFGAVPVCVQIWTYRSAPARFETSSALMVTVFQVALAAGSACGGGVVDRFGVASTFACGAALALLCGVVVWRSRAPAEAA